MSIIEIMQRFSSAENCQMYLEKVRWGGRPICPYCKSAKTCRHASNDRALTRIQCQKCNKAFSVTVGTIMHRSHLPLHTWLIAICLIVNAKKSISARQLGRDLGIRANTALSLKNRIADAMATDPEQARLFSGIVEMDECYIGGKPRKRNNHDGKRNKRGRGTDKMKVVGMVERNGNARAVANSRIDSTTLRNMVIDNVDRKDAILMTDQYHVYKGMKRIINHYAVDHTKHYVAGGTHTNTVEGFWALLKRAWYGQHHWYSRGNAHRYINEACYKYNNRNNTNIFERTVRLCIV